MERARAPCRDAWVDCERGVKRFLLFRGGPPGLEFSILELGILDLYVGRVLLVVAVHGCTAQGVNRARTNDTHNFQSAFKRR
jgi:hypothetical protein